MSNTVLTEERAKLLSEILVSDKDRAAKLLKLGASEAMRKINELGHDFKLEEIEAYGEAIMSANKLNDDALKNVAGGAGSGNMEQDILPLILLPLAPAVVWAATRR